MTQEDKELLLKDLCARLPYGVKMNHIADDEISPRTLIGIAKDMITLESSAGYSCVDVEHYKPYLFPLSSMTNEQQKEANIFDDMDMDILSENLDRNRKNKTNIPTPTFNYTDWLNVHHFDYRGLIPKGLANDATGLNIY